MKAPYHHTGDSAGEDPSTYLERAFQLGLRLYPAAHRRSYGREMLRDFRLFARDAHRAGRIALWGFAAAAAADLLSGALRCHLRRASRALAPAPTAATPAPGPRRPFSRHDNEASTMTTLPHDLTVAARRLRSSPAFTLVATLTLALGIGANTAIFSVVYGVLLRPLGVADAEGLAQVRLHRVDVPAESMGLWPRHLDILEGAAEGRGGIERLTTYAHETVTLEGQGRAEEVGNVVMVDGDFFPTLGVEPILGRALGPADIQPDRRGDVAVLGEAWWRQRFGADRSILGRTLIFDGQPVVVVGVMPGGIPMPQNGVQLWMPQGWDPEDPTFYGRLGMLARLEPGADPGLAAEVLAGTIPELTEVHPRIKGYTFALRGFRETLVGSSRPTLLAVAA
ncbi:MAG: ABC transporter permease, partial [Holophagales bacterium]|nr:ABC transporter permease [Holophagales bacterium]